MRGGVVVLSLSCLLLFGNYYCYDNPAALNRQLRAHFGFQYEHWQYVLNLLYVVYSFPNMFLPFFGGRLVDVFGARVLLLYSSLGCIGQLLFAFGIHCKSVWITLIGRFLFGVGGESIVVIQGALMASCFEGQMLTFALGLNLCVSRLGSVSNAVLSPLLDRHFGVEAAVMGGSVACIISFTSAIYLLYILPPESPPESPGTVHASNHIISSPVLDPELASVSTVTASRRLHVRVSTSSTMHYNANHRPSIASFHSLPPPGETTPLLAASLQSLPLPGPPPPSTPSIFSCFSVIALFPVSFWILCLLYVIFYGTAWCFNNTASDFLQENWYPDDAVTAGFVMSLPDTTSAFLAVLIGLFIPPLATSPHLNTLLLVSSFATMMACHFALSLMSSSGSLPEVATTVSSPIMALVMLGVAYSINPVVVWPGVAVVIHRHERAERAKKHRAAVRRRRAAAAAAAAISGATVVAEGNIALGDTDDENDDVTSVSSVDSDSGDGSRDTVLGTAYGVCTSALNVGLVVVPLCAAGVRVAAGWAGLELFYAGIAALGVLGALSLWAVDGFVEDFRARAPSC